MAPITVFQGSNGQYYGEVDLWERFESGVWSPCCWDASSGEEWIQTEDDELLYLCPVSLDDLPNDIQVQNTSVGVRVQSCPETT